MPDDVTLIDWARGRLHRSSEVARYDRGLAPVPVVVRLWRALTHSRRWNRRAALPRCQHCGYLIAQAAASPTGWTHGPHWKGIRCPGDVTGLSPGRGGRLAVRPSHGDPGLAQVLDDHVDPRIARYRSCALASKAGSTSEFRVLL